MSTPNLATTLLPKQSVPEYEFELVLPGNMRAESVPIPLPAKTIEASEYFTEVKPSFFKKSLLESPVLFMTFGISIMVFVSATSILAYKSYFNDKNASPSVTTKSITSTPSPKQYSATPVNNTATQSIAQQQDVPVTNDVRTLRGEAPIITPVQAEPPVLPRVAASEYIEKSTRPAPPVQPSDKVSQRKTDVAPKTPEKTILSNANTNTEPKERPRTIFKKQDTGAKPQPESTQNLF